MRTKPGAGARLSGRSNRSFKSSIMRNIRTPAQAPQESRHSYAAQGNAVDTFKALLAHGADVNARDSYQNTPLH